MGELTKDNRRGIASVMAGVLIFVFAANAPINGTVLAVFGTAAFVIGLLFIRFQ